LQGNGLLQADLLGEKKEKATAPQPNILDRIKQGVKLKVALKQGFISILGEKLQGRSFFKVESQLSRSTRAGQAYQ